MRYRSKPIDAFQWTGENEDQLKEWHRSVAYQAKPFHIDSTRKQVLVPNPKEGYVFRAEVSDYIILDSQGCFHVMQAIDFELIYECALPQN